jgi:phosphoglycolate phosphatase-like HAD superfamily hydrolase
MVGDSTRDIEMAKAAGLVSVKVESAEKTAADFQCKDLLEFAGLLSQK